MKSTIVLCCSWIVASALLSPSKMFPQVLNAVVLSEESNSNSSELTNQINPEVYLKCERFQHTAFLSTKGSSIKWVVHMGLVFLFLQWICLIRGVLIDLQCSRKSRNRNKEVIFLL